MRTYKPSVGMLAVIPSSTRLRMRHEEHSQPDPGRTRLDANPAGGVLGGDASVSCNGGRSGRPG